MDVVPGTLLVLLTLSIAAVQCGAVSCRVGSTRTVPNTMCQFYESKKAHARQTKSF